MKTKIKVGDLDKKLTFPSFRKEFLRLVTDMKTETVEGGTQPDDAIPIFIQTQHTFVDDTAHPLVVLAGDTPAWKKIAKEAFKADKKAMLEGRCFVQNEALHIIVEKGSLKLTELKKAIKELLKKANLKSVVFTDGKTNTALNGEESNMDDSVKREEEKVQGRATIQKMNEQLDGLMDRLGIKL